MNRHTEATQRYRENKRAEGICVYGGCWDASLRGTSLCAQHNQQAKEGESRRRALRQAMRPLLPCRYGQCFVFVRVPQKYCNQHRNHAAYQRTYYARKQAMGICGKSGCHAMAAPDRASCPVCLERGKEYQRRRRHDKIRSAAHLR